MAEEWMAVLTRQAPRQVSQRTCSAVEAEPGIGDALDAQEF